jgi:hypothetical protein
MFNGKNEFQKAKKRGVETNTSFPPSEFLLNNNF